LIAVSLAAIALGGCTLTGGGDDMAGAAMMERAEAIAASTGASADDIAAGVAEGQAMQQATGDARNSFETTCSQLEEATRDPATLALLDASAAKAFAKCAGFMG